MRGEQQDTQWFPMVEAPTDGTTVTLYVPGDPKDLFGGGWCGPGFFAEEGVWRAECPPDPDVVREMPYVYATVPVEPVAWCPAVEFNPWDVVSCDIAFNVPRSQ